MALTKQTLIDKVETVKVETWFVMDVRENTQILEDKNVISEKFHRYRLLPDHDVSTINDPVVKAQFKAVMTKAVKDNYATFLASQTEEVSESE